MREDDVTIGRLSLDELRRSVRWEYMMVEEMEACQDFINEFWPDEWPFENITVYGLEETVDKKTLTMLRDRSDGRGLRMERLVYDKVFHILYDIDYTVLHDYRLERAIEEERDKHV